MYVLYCCCLFVLISWTHLSTTCLRTRVCHPLLQTQRPPCWGEPPQLLWRAWPRKQCIIIIITRLSRAETPRRRDPVSVLIRIMLPVQLVPHLSVARTQWQLLDLQSRGVKVKVSCMSSPEIFKFLELSCVLQSTCGVLSYDISGTVWGIVPYVTDNVMLIWCHVMT